MHLTCRNVNHSFHKLVRMFNEDGVYDDGLIKQANIVRKSSRNGDVLKLQEPIIITYTHPTERVLFNAVRDANPFFHLYESLWMLAGRNDIAPLAWYAKNMLNYSDDGKTSNGAYGYRWRQHARLTTGTDYVGPDERAVRTIETEYIDQLQILIAHLKAQPDSRRAVLQMWNVEDDLLKIGQATCPRCGGPGCYQCDKGDGDYPGAGEWASKDVCCNLSVMFSLREVPAPCWDSAAPSDEEMRPIKLLDMTVTNRSNDLMWGMLGANYVHFTMLQEYMSASLGVKVGRYHHMTNDLHVYDNDMWKQAEGMIEWCETYDMMEDPYEGTGVDSGEVLPLVENIDVFNEELHQVVANSYGPHEHKTTAPTVDRLLHKLNLQEPFLNNVAVPMFSAFACYKDGRFDSAEGFCGYIQDEAWRVAATNWIGRRKAKREGVSK